MNIGRIIGFLIIVLGLLFFYYFDFENEISGFILGVVIGLGTILIIKGKLGNLIKTDQQES